MLINKLSNCNHSLFAGKMCLADAIYACILLVLLAISFGNYHFARKTGEATFSSMTGPSLVKVVDVAYQETSKHLLHVLHNKYNFTKHLKVSVQCIVHFYLLIIMSFKMYDLVTRMSNSAVVWSFMMTVNFLSL